jgi:phytoene synthase
LPLRAAAAVLAARNVYREIGRRVEARGPHAWDDRTFVSGRRKILLAARGAGGALAQQALLRARPLENREDLWRRPRRKV